MNLLPSAEIQKLWRLKAINGNSIIELRALKNGAPAITKIFRGDKYTSVNELKLAFEQEAIRLKKWLQHLHCYESY